MLARRLFSGQDVLCKVRRTRAPPGLRTPSPYACQPARSRHARPRRARVPHSVSAADGALLRAQPKVATRAATVEQDRLCRLLGIEKNLNRATVNNPDEMVDIGNGPEHLYGLFACACPRSRPHTPPPVTLRARA